MVPICDRVSMGAVTTLLSSFSVGDDSAVTVKSGNTLVIISKSSGVRYVRVYSKMGSSMSVTVLSG